MAFITTGKAPGVYIQEIDVPGPIAGVGTSTAAFVGPFARGPVDQPRRVTSAAEFIQAFGGIVPTQLLHPGDTSLPVHPMYTVHAVQGFFRNGGQIAYCVRIGRERRAKLDVRDETGTPVFTLSANESGLWPLEYEVHVTHSSIATSGLFEARVESASEKTVTLAEGEDAGRFRRDDAVQVRQGATAEAATIASVDPATRTLALQAALSTTFDGGRVRLTSIADDETEQTELRLAAVAGIEAGSVLRVSQNGTAATALVESVDADTETVKLAEKIGTAFTGDAPILVQTQEFSLRFVSRVTGEQIAAHPHQSMHPDHSRFIGRDDAVAGMIVTLPDESGDDESSDTPPIPALPAATDGAPLRFSGGDDLEDLEAADYERGIETLRQHDDVNILCVPDAITLDKAGAKAVQTRMIDHCTAMEDRFAILDPLPGRDSAGIEAQRNTLASDRGFAALYYPRIVIANPLASGTITVPPSGHIAGVFADTDSRVGVFKAPANVGMRGVLGLERILIDAEQGPLNDKGVNVLRRFTGRGVVVWGARTVSTRTQWRYVNIRRFVLFVEQSIKRGTDFAVFEPITVALRQRVVRQVREFLIRQWEAGALVGRTPDEGFRVRADDELNPPDQVALGILTIEVILAPAPPAEFVVFRVIQRPGGPVVEE